MLLSACANEPVIDDCPKVPEVIAAPVAPLPVPAPVPATVCTSPVDTVGDKKVEAAKRELAIANRWHQDKSYRQAYEVYERVLAHPVNPLVHAYALTGMIVLRLDRDSDYYDRPAARVALDVLRQRVGDTAGSEYGPEARLLQFVAESAYFSDLGKDQLVLKNSQLQNELEQRDEAIKRLRELTIGN